MIEKKAITQVPIHELLASRWSGRAFDPDRLLAHEQILALLEAARWAPSCFGDQPWRYVICDKQSNRQAWDTGLSCLSEGNQGWARNAPLLILSLADSQFMTRDSANRWGQHDTGAASENLCLQATAMGMMAHQMGGFDKDKAAEVFAVPDRYEPMAMIAVGYQLALEAIDEEQKERELKERARWPLGENFFDGTWDKPFD